MSDQILPYLGFLAIMVAFLLLVVLELTRAPRGAHDGRRPGAVPAEALLVGLYQEQIMDAFSRRPAVQLGREAVA